MFPPLSSCSLSQAQGPRRRPPPSRPAAPPARRSRRSPLNHRAEASRALTSRRPLGSLRRIPSGPFATSFWVSLPRPFGYLCRLFGFLWRVLPGPYITTFRVSLPRPFGSPYHIPSGSLDASFRVPLPVGREGIACHRGNCALDLPVDAMAVRLAGRDSSCYVEMWRGSHAYFLRCHEY